MPPPKKNTEILAMPQLSMLVGTYRNTVYRFVSLDMSIVMCLFTVGYLTDVFHTTVPHLPTESHTDEELGKAGQEC